MLPPNFESKVAREKNGCWLWFGATSDGYGQGHFKGKTRQAHRVSYELANGPIPEGMQLDHLCRIRCCINPAHLEPVTCKENVHRGNGYAGINSRKTHCKNGHPLSGENLCVTLNGQRNCRICRKAVDRKHDRKRRLKRSKRECEDCGEEMKPRERRYRCKSCDALCCGYCIHHIHNFARMLANEKTA